MAAVKKTKDAQLGPAEQKVYDKLKEVRASTTVALKPTPLLKTEITNIEGEKIPFTLRYYQVQGAFHLLVTKRMVLGDDTGLGKTVETIAALCYMLEKDPTLKPIVVTTKSSVRQWASELRRFTNGLRPIVVGEDKKSKETPVEARTRSYEEWAKEPNTVLIMNYALFVRDWNHGGFQPPKKNGKLSKEPVKPGLLDGITLELGQRVVAIYDEASAFKNMRTKTWEMVRFLSDRAGRAYGLTATLLKNHLEEGYSIYKALRPSTFGNKQDFLDTYCVYRLQEIGRKKVPLVLGYRNIDEFKSRIDPFFLGRKKHMVSTELPVVNSREVPASMSAAEDAKYDEALSGVMELGDGEVKDFEENKALVSLIYCQQIVDSLALLKFSEGDEVTSGMAFEPETHTIGAVHSKEQALVDLLQEELEGDKVIIYTRFERLVTRLTEILRRNGIKSVRITGKENDKKRQDAQKVFQDLKSDTKVVFITSAGSEAINLQAAAATVFYDLPWSWGEYVQVLGRMVRIGSPHKGVMTYHLLAERPGGGKTIDHHVLALLRKKKALIDKVIGEAAVGALEFEKDKSLQGLVKLLQTDRA